jgi:hypothetical protein
MSNGDGPWTKYQASSEAGPWAKYATPVETPDPTKPDPSAVTKPQMETSFFGGAHPTSEQQKVISERGPVARAEVPKMAREVVGAVAGGEAFGAASKGLPWLYRLIASSSGAGAGAGVGNLAGGGSPKEALGEAAKTTMLAGGEGLAVKGAGAVASKLSTKAEPLAKINKLLGVDAKEVIPGKTPASLDEFAANPARGAQKYGLTEEKLKTMNALERNSAIMQARDKAGRALDATLEAATQTGKKVNIQDTLNETFSEIADPKLLEQAEKRMLQILDKAGVSGKALRDLTPMEARTVQRGLDNFAKFANESEAKSFGDIADQLRTGISKETRKVVPESAEFDRDYTDLVHASNATQKGAKEFATTVPENKLRKWLIRGLITGGLGAAGAAGYEGAKHMSTPVP